MTRRPTYTDLERMNRAKDQKIARMEQGRHKQDIREGKLSARITELQQDIAALESALDRKTDECLRWQNIARPLLTDAEDEAGTKRMAELELRGQIW